jgi:hypothetical protein
MANAQTLNAIAGLLKGFQSGYGGAKEQAASAEERAMRNRFQQSQIENTNKSQALDMLKYQSGLPEQAARTGYYESQNKPVPSEIVDPTLRKLGMNPLGQPVSSQTFSTLGGMLNNQNTNSTREAIGRNTKGNSPADALKEWSKTKNEYEKGLIDYDKSILANTTKLNLMQDEADKKRIMDELENAKAGKEVLKFKLQNHLLIGRQNNVNPMLLASTSDSDFLAYKAKQDADKKAADDLAKFQQGSVMPVSPTAQPSMGAPSLKDMLLKKLGM